MLHIPPQKLRELLEEERLVDAQTFEAVRIEAERLGQNLLELLVSRNIVTREYLSTLLSNYFRVPLAGLGSRKVNGEVLKLLPEEIARERRAVIFAREPDGGLSVALEDPGNLETIEFLERFLSARVTPYLALEGDLNKGFALYGAQRSSEYQKLIEANISESLRLGRRGEEAAAEVPIVGIVDNVIAFAFSSRASDIHIEIFEEFVLVRYRVDGILREVLRISREIHPAVVARVKLLAGLKIDEHYRPQDGRFRVKVGVETLDIRVSVLPTYYGEKIVMRLLSGASRPLALREVGMLEDTEKILLENMKRTYGMVLICGPTGSGKTTTLYSMLNLLNRPEANIVTVEDPIEYDIKYVNQTQINPQSGITFATGLRAILRQDPNIILIGEIRDNETASIAVQAALTGHLVLSSLHTNDAPTAIPRLIDMEVPPFLASAVLNAVASQRLVRRICPQCIYSMPPSREALAAIERQLVELKISDYKLPRLVYAGKGCPACGGTGYRGRLGIFEVLNVTEAVRALITSSRFSLDLLRETARKEGMIGIFEDGLRKVERGLTTVEELIRVVKE